MVLLLKRVSRPFCLEVLWASRICGSVLWASLGLPLVSLDLIELAFCLRIQGSIQCNRIMRSASVFGVEARASFAITVLKKRYKYVALLFGSHGGCIRVRWSLVQHGDSEI